MEAPAGTNVLQFQLVLDTGNRPTSRLTLVLVGAADLPSVSTGALVGRVAWFTKLGAAFVRFHGAQSLVCIVVKQSVKVAASADQKRSELTTTMPTPAPHRFHSGPP